VRPGELYRVPHPSARDPKKSRAFVIVSRQVVIDSRFSTVVFAPIYSAYDGLSTQVPVGVDEGLKHESSIHCDELVSLPKSVLTVFFRSGPPISQSAIGDTALATAMDIARNKDIRTKCFSGAFLEIMVCLLRILDDR
jgi:mRNA interferase MazF